jgi:hypothetical protein
MGQYAVWVVDEKFRLLHTEPLCILSEKWHSWFFDWLKEEIEKINAPYIPLKD